VAQGVRRGSRILKSLAFLLPALLAACSDNTPEKAPLPKSNEACSKIALQSTVWTPALTRNVLSCLFSKSPETSLRVQETPTKNFEHLSRYLTQAFQDPSKRAELARLIQKTRDVAPLVSPFMRDPLLLEMASRPTFVGALPWLQSSLGHIQELLNDRPELLIDWIEEWNHLEAGGKLLGQLHPPVAALLSGIAAPGEDTPQLLGLARVIFGNLASESEKLGALALLSSTQNCDSAQAPVLTHSPMAQTLEFFRADRKNPEHFLNSVQQGFAYWSRVCRPRGEALEQSHVKSVLVWIFDLWEPLQNFFASSGSLAWVAPGQELILVAARASLEGETRNPLLGWLFDSKVTAALVESLQRDPVALKEWIGGFEKLAPLFLDLPEGPLSLPPALLDLARKDPSWASWLTEISRVPAPVMQEIWTLAQTLSPGGLGDAAEAWDSDAGRDTLRFLEWILNVRRNPEPSTPAPRYRNPVASEEAPLSEELKRARALMSACLKETRLDSIESCLASKGLPTPPAFVRELWKLSNSGKALQAAHHADILELASPLMARKTWNPLLGWIRDTGVPVPASVDVVSQLGELMKKYPKHAWDESLARLWTPLRATIAKPLTPNNSGMRAYRWERAADIDPNFFADVELRNVLLEPNFFKRILHWISSDPTTLVARRSLVKLQRERFQMPFWSAEGRLETVSVTATEALDLLFWELQIPVISSPGTIRGVLESWSELRTPAEVVEWLDTKDGLLGLGIGLAGLVNNPGEGLLRRLENARFIVRALRDERRLQIDLLRASRVLDLFRDSRGRFTNATVKSLMALHQFGFVHLLSTAFDPTASWTKSLESNTRVAISDRVIEALARNLRQLIDRTPPADLRALAAGQMRQDLWLLRGLTASLMTLAFEDPALMALLDRESAALLSLLSETHTRVFLPWAAKQRSKSELARDQELSRLRQIILTFNSTPKSAWLSLITELAHSPELAGFWPQLEKLSPSDIERLTLWLESGIPSRLLVWNRLMKIQNPDATP
jgi:hypothetical protein